MKKGIIVSITVILLITIYFGFYFMISFYSKSDGFVEPDFPEVTYEFSGTSDHFIFNIGKVYFGKCENQIYINDFRQVKKIKNLENVSVTVYFKDEEFYTFSNQEKAVKLNKSIDGITFYEGDYCSDETSAFNNTSAETFKEDILIELTYCLKNGSCEAEEFSIEYK